MEHANTPMDRQAGRRTGVFVGIGNSDFAQRLAMSDECALRMDHYSGTGHAFSIAANRLSYLFDLRGPSIAIDTACSSSLVALHLACESLRNVECDMALAAGVNVLLSPLPSICFPRARMLAPDGRCKTFDAGADGYVRSEGCGVVVLKRYSDALKHADRILALVCGSAVNQDGRTNGITAPNGLSQQAVIRDAMARSGITPDQISFIEAHGTGTVLGDLIELRSLAAVLGARQPGRQDCWLGSVKAHIGHLETAAGVASLIKVLLCLEFGEVPAQLHLKHPNPHIELAATPLRIATTRAAWPSGPQRRCAGISSFGFGGTNAHVVLEEAPQVCSPSNDVDASAYLLPLSAKDAAALQRLAGRYTTLVQNHPELDIGDLCYTASTGRSPFPHRLAMVLSSRQELIDRLQRFDPDTSGDGLRCAHAQPPERPPLQSAQALGCHSVLLLTKALAGTQGQTPPRLCLVTRGAQAVVDDDRDTQVAQAPLWGLGRVVAQEHPRLRCSLVDLSLDDPPDQIAGLVAECLADSPERQVAFRGDRRYAARLSARPGSATVPPPHRVEISRPGSLNDLIVRTMPFRRPRPGEVEIEIRAAGLNFRDVMNALGIYPAAPGLPVWLGDECAGCVTAIGAGVEGLRIGDEVLAVAPASFAAVTYATAAHVVPKPPSISFQQAATIPIAFTTALHALHHVARLARGERVLIHAAAGGVGLAAVQVARWSGATVFGTAGSPEKREYLHALGIEHVMDSRSSAFADDVMELTDGQGVNVVLNSLSGDAIANHASIGSTPERQSTTMDVRSARNGTTTNATVTRRSSALALLFGAVTP